MKIRKPATRLSAPSPMPSRYGSLRVNAAVMATASIATAPKDARIARFGCAASCRPQSTGAFTESVMKWYFTVPFRIQVVHPSGRASLDHAAAANAMPTISPGTQTE